MKVNPMLPWAGVSICMTMKLVHHVKKLSSTNHFLKSLDYCPKTLWNGSSVTLSHNYKTYLNSFILHLLFTYFLVCRTFKVLANCSCKHIVLQCVFCQTIEPSDTTGQRVGILLREHYKRRYEDMCTKMLDSIPRCSFVLKLSISKCLVVLVNRMFNF